MSNEVKRRVKPYVVRLDARKPLVFNLLKFQLHFLSSNKNGHTNRLKMQKLPFWNDFEILNSDVNMEHKNQSARRKITASLYDTCKPV